MKRRFLCRVTSFALAAILAAESSMTVAAAESRISQETVVVEHTETVEENGTEVETESGTAAETEVASESENVTEVSDETVAESETEVDSEATEETESTSESVAETESESESEEENGISDETEQETEFETETEVQIETETETQQECVEEAEEISSVKSAEDLAAPVLEKLAVSEDGKVTFEWALVENAEGYHVYRSENVDEQGTLIENGVTIGETKVSFEDGSAELGKAYYYKVCAYRTVAEEGEEGKVEEGAFSETVNSKVELESIAWSEEAFAALDMEKGETKQLSIAYNPVNATRPDSTWSSSNTSVVKVDKDGVVTAVGKGTATITAKAGTKAVTSTVSVTVGVEQVILNKDSLNLRIGSAGVLEAFVEPSDADAKVVWTSDDTNIATVNNGIVRAVSAGSTVIRATAGGVSTECQVTVTVPVNKIELEKDSIEIEKGGKSKEVAVNLLPLNATNREITAVPEDDGLVSCEVQEGKVIFTSGAELGKTTVKITVDGLSTSLTVNVVEEETTEEDTSEVIPVRKLSFNLSDLEKTIALETGETYALTAQILPENATNQTITWTSSDEKVAVVSEAGLITATGKGMAQITAKTENGVCDKVTVSVSNVVEEVAIESNGKVLYCNGSNPVFSGRTVPDSFDIVMTDSGLKCAYRSSDEKVATVDETGHVVAVAPGTAQIVAIHQESGKSDAVTVTVKRLIEKIKLPVTETTVAVGTKMKLTAEIAPKEVSTEELVWKVTEDSPKDCLEYDEKNKVFKAGSVGTAKIVATAGDNGKVRAEIAVTIISTSAAEKVSLTYKGKDSAALKSGNQIALVTKVTDKNGNEKSLNDVKMVYKSSNEKVATVDENGNVTAIAGGTAKITASVMDGSNVSGSCTVTVEQRPEQIVFAREEFVVAPKGAVTLTPSILPAKAKNKTVSWEIPVEEIVVPEGYEFDDSTKKKLVKIDQNGKVTIAQAAPEGLTATVRCTSKAFGKKETPVSQEVTIRVGKTKVTSLKMKKASLELTGLGTQAQLEFTAKGADASTTYKWTSSKEEVITVDENGMVTVQGYGTAKVTLCVDNAKAASCTIAAYPVKKAHTIAAASNSYGIQQAKNDGNAFVQLSFINNNTKAKLDAELFTYVSSNPELVYVDEKGVAYANPHTVLTKNTTVTVTATLKDDPLKRKATTKVTVWKEQQIKNIAFQYMESGKEKYEEITDYVEDEFKAGSTFKLKAIALNAENESISGKELTFKISDTSMADIEKDEKSSNTIIVTVKKAGKFKITCTANDSMHVSRQVAFGMYSGTPILEAASLGTINKAGEIVEVNGAGVLSDTVFTMTGANGSEVSDVSIESVKRKQEDGSLTDINLGFTKRDLKIVQQGNSQFQLAMDSEILSQSTTKTGTYEIVLSVKRTDMEIESSFSDDGAWEKVTTTFKIANSKPSVKISDVTVNSFERGTWTKLKINTKAEIENITLAAEDTLEDYYEVMERQDGWYIAIKENQFENCASKKIKGRFRVAVKGYENPVAVSVTVTAKSTKPSLKQLSVPDVLVSQGDTAEITLYNKTAKQNLTDYSVSLKSEKNKKWNILNKNAEDTFEIGFVESVRSITKNASYKQKIVVEKDGWRTPIELDVTVKASTENAKPAVTFGKQAITLNTSVEARKETAAFAVKTNKSNAYLKEGAWEFVNSAYNDMFTAEYLDGSLTIGLKEEAVDSGKFTKSSYKLQFVNVFEGTTDYEKVKTAAITVNINKKKPAITVKVSGKMDLLNRKASTLTAAVSVSGVSADIAYISLANGSDSEFTNNFYSVRTKNKITVYARNAAELVTGKAYKGKVAVTLKNGTVLEKDISFKLTQSVPKLKAVASQTVYKAEEDKVMDFNLNESLPEGIQIKEVVTRVLPTGFGVEYDNGHAYVVLNDDTLKPGKYTIQADVYFKGAQKTTGRENGKPVRVKITVQVKEQ